MTDSVSPVEMAQTHQTALEHREVALDSARRYAGKSRAENTWRGYRAGWRRFLAWCDIVGLAPLPAAPETVALFVASEADKGLATATLEHRLSAIRLAHLGQGHPSPHNTPVVLEVLRGVRRDRRDQPRFKRQPAAPAVDAEIKAMVDTLGTEHPRDLRDRALLLYGFATALRCSELVRLHISDIEPREAGDVVNIRYSKGDQAGIGQKVAALAVPGSDYCPISALRRWLQSASIASGPLFRRVARDGTIGDTSLSDKTVVRLIKSCAGAAGFNAARYSGHSLRRGFLTSAAMNGADVLKMVAQSRHADINTLLEYVEDRQLFDNHAGQRLLEQPDRMPEENE